MRNGSNILEIQEIIHFSVNSLFCLIAQINIPNIYLKDTNVQNMYCKITLIIYTLGYQHIWQFSVGAL